MAGPGMAVRLHEFKENHRTGPLCGKAGGAMTLSRQGRDVRGLYPGQLARVHVIHSPHNRQSLMSVEDPPRSHELREEERYQRSFDLLTLEALVMSRAEFRQQSHHYTTSYSTV